MTRIFGFVVIAMMGLSACGGPPPGPQIGPDGNPLPKVYKIRSGQTAKIQFSMLDSINTLRSAANVAPVELDARLNAAAATHAQDMSLQNRPWHFGSDGSSPIDRAIRVGYTGQLVGENISETYETELETLSAWMDDENTRRVILAPDATDLGFSWFQESNGKIWWTLVMGSDRLGADPLS
jgi:uncharacterized protein YkwD